MGLRAEAKWGLCEVTANLGDTQASQRRDISAHGFLSPLCRRPTGRPWAKPSLLWAWFSFGRNKGVGPELCIANCAVQGALHTHPRGREGKAKAVQLSLLFYILGLHGCFHQGKTSPRKPRSQPSWACTQALG